MEFTEEEVMELATKHKKALALDADYDPDGFWVVGFEDGSADEYNVSDLENLSKLYKD